MEYEFTYQRDTRQYGLVLAEEFQSLAHFLVEEFATEASAITELLQQLTGLNQYQDWQYQGKEFLLEVHQAEVLLRHNSLFQDKPTVAEQQRLIEEQLQLDEHGLSCHCGLEDLIKLLQDWQQFLAE